MILRRSVADEALGRCVPPPLLFEGRWWPGEELAGMAAGWRDAVAGELARAPALVALPMANHPEAVALLFALSSFDAPVALLPSMLRGWQSAPPVPAGTPLFLPPSLRSRAVEGERLGLRVVSLGDPRPSSPAPPARYMTAPGFVFFTSGSTGTPRPVYRTTAQLIDAGLAPVTAVGFAARGGFLGSLPLDRTFGMHHSLMAAALLRRPLALLPRFRHHEVLELFTSGDYHYWAGTPVMADALGRCRLPTRAPRPHPAPPVCVISGRVSGPVSAAFRARFGVPLRQLYGTTETGAITMEAGPAHLVRSEVAGLPLPGVRVRVGDDPRSPAPAGTLGRVWVSGPGCAPGYGFPPDLQPLPGVDGWWATPDAGQIDAGGSLVVAGRMDDCVRTAAGHLVSTAMIAATLEACPGVDEALVLPIGAGAEPVLAALLQSPRPLDMKTVRAYLAGRLPAWSQPRVLEQTRALPRLASGKPDRLACASCLERAR